MVTKCEELAAEIIDDVCEVVETQHPEIKLHTKNTKEANIEDPAVICCEGYYNLELEIADKIKKFMRMIENAKRIKWNIC